MKSKRITISVSETQAVSAVLCIPGRTQPEAAVITAHGAGNDMNNPLVVSFCEQLADAGYLAVRFNFPYKERGRKAPDRPEILQETWRRVFHTVRDHAGYPLQRIFAAGKSMGGRVASEMLAEGNLPACGIIFLGYPLHPAGNKEKLRDQHLYQIRVPMLFFAGTRDPLCDLNLLEPVLRRLGTRAQWSVIEGADHSFNVPKSSGLTTLDIYKKIVCQSIRWLERSAANPVK